MLNRGLAAIGPGNGDDVEAGFAFEQIVPLHIGESQPREPPLLGIIDGVGRMPRVVRRSRFYLNENDRAAIDGHEIDFANAVAVSAGDDYIAKALQVASGSVFAATAKGLWRKDRAF
jgi:hypothetical protein